MLGMIDWGIGGIGVYRVLKRELGLPVLYLSDTGVTPYGRMKPLELRDRVERVIAFLESQGATHILIGCNAASTAIPALRSKLPILGMIDAGIRTAASKKPRRLGLIGGRRTVLSGVYRNGFRRIGIDVEQRIAQPLSALIEAGELDSEELRAEAARILAPLRSCSHILLACTHYPAIETELAKFVSPKTRFLDPAQDLVKQAARWRLSRSGRSRFMTTGNPTQMERSAQAAFGVKLVHASAVKF